VLLMAKGESNAAPGRRYGDSGKTSCFTGEGTRVRSSDSSSARLRTIGKKGHAGPPDTKLTFAESSRSLEVHRAYAETGNKRKREGGGMWFYPNNCGVIEKR